MPQALLTHPQGFTATLRRFGPDIWFFAGLVIWLNLHLVGIGSPFHWILFPLEVQNGQWWRLLTHPFVHLTFYHLALDAGAFFILYGGLIETRVARKLSYVGVAALASLTAALVLSPDFDRLGLCGLSGIAHGLMAVSGLEMMADPRHRIAGWVSFLTVAAKGGIETIHGEVLFAFLHMGLCGTPIAACHLGGVAGASVLFLLFWAADRRKRTIRSAGLHRAATIVARICYRFRSRVTVTLLAPVAPSAAAASRLRRLVSEGAGSPDCACDRRRSVTTSGFGPRAWSPTRKAADCFEPRC